MIKGHTLLNDNENGIPVKPRGAYTPVVLFNNTIYLSGQVAFRGDDPVLPETLEEQTLQVLMNIRAILSTKGADLSHLLSMTCYLAEGQEWAVFNDAYAKGMEGFDLPVRTTVVVKALPLGALVEITAVARAPGH